MAWAGSAAGVAGSPATALRGAAMMPCASARVMPSATPALFIYFPWHSLSLKKTDSQFCIHTASGVAAEKEGPFAARGRPGAAWKVGRPAAPIRPTAVGACVVCHLCHYVPPGVAPGPLRCRSSVQTCLPAVSAMSGRRVAGQDAGAAGRPCEAAPRSRSCSAARRGGAGLRGTGHHYNFTEGQIAPDNGGS